MLILIFPRLDIFKGQIQIQQLKKLQKNISFLIAVPETKISLFYPPSFLVFLGMPILFYFRG